MLPTDTAMISGDWVRCRSRYWRAIERRLDGGVAVWCVQGRLDLPRYLFSPPDEMTVVRTRTRMVTRRRWMRACADLLSDSRPCWWPRGARRLPIDRHPYQYVPAMLLLSGGTRRLLLADDVGLGKTVQAAILLHELHARDPEASSLVVVPAPLTAQWREELRVRAALDARVLDGAALREETRLDAEANRAGACVITSLDLVRQPEVAALLSRTSWTLLILDEAHAAAPGTARLDAVERLARVSERLLLLTATPHGAGEAGVEALLALGRRPGERPMQVLRRASATLQRPERRTRVLRVHLPPPHAAICRALDAYAERARRDGREGGLLPALVLRRRGASCPAALVRSLSRRLAVLGTAAPDPQPALPWNDSAGAADDVDGDDDEAMRVGSWNDERAEREVLGTLLATAERLPPAGAVLDAVARLIRRCREPVVVYTAFVDALRALRAALPAAMRVVAVHGLQPMDLRVHAVEAFVGGHADVLLATDAAAEGLNLHERCRLVLHAEVPVSARRFIQRTGRVDRFGQARRVHTVIFASDTGHDREALERLSLGRERADAWASRAASARCRRLTVAERALAADARGDTTTAHLRDRSEAGRLACSLTASRWHRLTRRLQVPPDTAALAICTLDASGGPLVASESPVVCLTAEHASGLEAGCLEAAARPIVVRQLRRVTRTAAAAHRCQLDAWDAAVRLKRDLLADPALFDEGPPDAAIRPDDEPTRPTVRMTLRLLLQRRP